MKCHLCNMRPQKRFSVEETSGDHLTHHPCFKPVPTRSGCSEPCAVGFLVVPRIESLATVLVIFFIPNLNFYCTNVSSKEHEEKNVSSII